MGHLYLSENDLVGGRLGNERNRRAGRFSALRTAATGGRRTPSLRWGWRPGTRERVEKMSCNLFGFEKFRELSQIWQQIVQIFILFLRFFKYSVKTRKIEANVFKFLKIFAKFRQKVINIEDKMATVAER